MSKKILGVLFLIFIAILLLSVGTAKVPVPAPAPSKPSIPVTNFEYLKVQQEKLSNPPSWITIPDTFSPNLEKKNNAELMRCEQSDDECFRTAGEQCASKHMKTVWGEDDDGFYFHCREDI